MRQLSRALVWVATIALGACAPIQQHREGPFQPSAAEILALGECEGVAPPKQGQDMRLKSGVYDRLHGHWLIVHERRDEIISCLVGKHGWSALSAPDGRRGARAPR